MTDRLVILGGTGLLGQHTAVALAARGLPATLVARAQSPLLPGLHPGDVTLTDLEAAPHDHLVGLLRGAGAVVQAMGADDRVTPTGSSSAHFQKHLVDTTARLVRAAVEAGVKRYVICGSYFCTWHRMNPGLRLPEHHPYVRARLDQASRAEEIAGSEMAVCVLEIPYVFGTVPGRIPTWKQWLFDRLRTMPVAMYPDGGTSVVTAAQVGRAAAAAALVGEPGARYPLADLQLTWKQLLAMILPALGKSPRVITVPRLLAEPTARRMGAALRRQGKEPGIDPKRLMRDIMCQRIFVDPSRAVNELGFTGGGVPEAIEESVRATYRVE